MLWDAASYSNKLSDITHKYPIVKLKSVIEHRSNFIKIDDQQEYKRCRVQLRAKGIELRDIVRGSVLKTKKQQVCHPNEFLVAEIDAKHGGYGIIPNELDGAIVSSHYFLYSIDTEKLLPDYLGLYIKTEEFFSQIQAVGSTNYAAIRPYQVLEYDIPLPTQDIQKQLVEDYKSCLQQAELGEQQANQLEKNIESYLLDGLGIEIKQAKQKLKNKLSIVESKEISRWDVAFILNHFELKAKYPKKSISFFINKFMTDDNNKSLRFESYKFPDQQFVYLGMEAIEKETGQVLEMQKINGNVVKSQTILVPKNYFIYGKLRPYLNKYWFNDFEEKIICSSEFFVFSINEEINNLFFKYVLSSSIIQNQINNNTSGVRMPRISEDIFCSLEIPLPPTDIQTQIVNHINTQKIEIKKLRLQAKTLKESAKNNFEAAIFE